MCRMCEALGLTPSTHTHYTHTRFCDHVYRCIGNTTQEERGWMWRLNVLLCKQAEETFPQCQLSLGYFLLSTSPLQHMALLLKIQNSVCECIRMMLRPSPGCEKEHEGREGRCITPVWLFYSLLNSWKFPLNWNKVTSEKKIGKIKM